MRLRSSERESLDGLSARRRGRRAGFTLVELLVVLLILVLLIALLFPVIAGAVRRAREASVQAEIQLISQALADFNSKNGMYPPSRWMIYESGSIYPSSSAVVASGAKVDTGTNSDVTVGQLFQRTSITFRKLWPKVLLFPGGASSDSTLWYDLNGDGIVATDANGPFLVQGHESLVFFLGGIPLKVTNPDQSVTFSVIGFGKDPSNPFTNGIVGNSGYSNNRNAPLFEFANERLQLTNSNNYPDSSQSAYAHGIPGYYDSISSPGTGPTQNFYAYFSTNPNGYDPNDVNFHIDADNNGDAPIWLNFGTAFGGTGSMAPNPYTTTCSIPAASTNHLQLPTYDKAQSFQIISAGTDGYFGVGGYYSPSTSGPALPYPSQGANANASTTSSDLSVRNLERDNLTNFHNGRLE